MAEITLKHRCSVPGRQGFQSLPATVAQQYWGLFPKDASLPGCGLVASGEDAPCQQKVNRRSQKLVLTRQKTNTIQAQKSNENPLFSIFIYSQIPLFSNLTCPRLLPIPKCGLKSTGRG